MLKRAGRSKNSVFVDVLSRCAWEQQQRPWLRERCTERSAVAARDEVQIRLRKFELGETRVMLGSTQFTLLLFGVRKNSEFANFAWIYRYLEFAHFAN